MKLIYFVLILIIFSPLRVEAQQTSSPVAEVFSTKVDAELHDIVWSSSGERLAVGLDDGINIYSDTLDLLAELQTNNTVFQLAWSADSNRLASLGYDDSTVKIWHWDSVAGELVFERNIFNDHGYPFVMGIAWSPDGNFLAITVQEQPPGFAGVIGTVEIWDTRTWMFQRNLLDEHEFLASPLSWSLDSEQLAGVASMCGVSEFFSCDIPYFFVADTNSGILTYQSQYYISSLYTLSWGSDEILAIGGQEEIWIYNANTKQISTRFINKMPQGHGYLNLDWSSDARNLVVGYFIEGRIEIIDVETAVSLLQFSMGNLNGMDLSPDDNFLATINSQAGLIEIWDVSGLEAPVNVPTATFFPTTTPTPQPR